MRHLFIEGDIGIGKSTAILRHLGEHMARAAGFGTVRTYEIAEDGVYKRRGFCHYPAKDMKKVDDIFCADNRGNFIWIDDDLNFSYKAEVFEEYSLQLLEAKPEDRFILMDEIGGFELLNENILQTYMRILDGDLPCIGVLKSRANKNSTKRNLELSNRLDIAYERFREYMKSKPEVVLLKAYRDRIDDLEEDIKQFLVQNHIV